MMISLIEPIAEYIIRFHLSVNCKLKKIEIKKESNMITSILLMMCLRL